MQNRSTSNSTQRSGRGGETRSYSDGRRNRERNTRSEGTRAGSSRSNSLREHYDARSTQARLSRPEQRDGAERSHTRDYDSRSGRASERPTRSSRNRSYESEREERTGRNRNHSHEGRESERAARAERFERNRNRSRSDERPARNRGEELRSEGQRTPGNMDGWDKFAHLQDGRSTRSHGRSQNLNSSWAADRAANSSWQLATFMPVLAIIAVVLIAAFLVGAISSCSSAPASDSAQEEQPTPLSISFNPTVQGIDSVSDPGTSVTGISLADSNACYIPQLSNEGQSEVESAVSAITNSNANVGFALVDMETGSGYAYNFDQRVYGASSFKGHVLIYGCQQALETGQTSMSKVNANAQEAIINSDNNSYHRMRRQFENTASETLSAWLQSMNISTSLANDTSFPHYSARESLKLWMNGYLYLNSSDSNQDITSWAKDMFSSTVVSPIRSGVDPSSGSAQEERIHSVALELQGAVLGKLKTVEVGTAKSEEENSSTVTVYDKAGWINGSDDDAVCDAGIIEEDGKAYLITIMSSLPDSDSSRAKVSNLASALWNQRASLVPEQGFTKA